MAAVLYTLLPRFRNLQVSDPSKKPPCRAVFLFLGQEDTATDRQSQADKIKPLKNHPRLNIPLRLNSSSEKKAALLASIYVVLTNLPITLLEV